MGIVGILAGKYVNPASTLWKLVSEFNRRKDADSNGHVKCCTCPRIKHWKEMDAGHFIPKGSGSTGKALEYYDKNIHAQCPECNRNKHKGRAHVEMVKIRYTEFMISKYGTDIFWELEQVRKKITLFKDYEYGFLIKEYKQKIKAL